MGPKGFGVLRLKKSIGHGFELTASDEKLKIWRLFNIGGPGQWCMAMIRKLSLL